MTPVLERVIAQLQPKGLWLFGSWARGTQSASTDIDLLIEGFEGVPVLKAYDQALEVIGDFRLTVQPSLHLRLFWRAMASHRSDDR